MGDNCIISSGAKIIGPVKIGNNCIIGANAVVIDNIPDNCVAVGVPAKIIKTDINILDYRDL
ncbi:MAG TPA: serine acetyltransferase [Campylobacterales bacterium]|nr:serine acetyltransferase [Campylobacterales bacterium]